MNKSPETLNFERMKSPEFGKAIKLFGKVCEAIKESDGQYRATSSSNYNIKNDCFVFVETLRLSWPDGYWYNAFGSGSTPADAHIACINDINKGMLSNLGIKDDPDDTDPELTDEQLDTQCTVDTACREFLSNFLSEKDCEDIEVWGELRDAVVPVLVRLTRKTEMAIYPYLHMAE